MLNLGNQRGSCCQGVSRRALLEVGACSALGLSLPALLARSARAESGKSPAKSVLLLWMWGGPSHHEMWDPKPKAPIDIRGPFGPISTATPGTQISELLPLTARETRRFNIIRSMRHDQKDHNVGGTVALTGSSAGGKASGATPLPGRLNPGLGSLVSYMTRDRAGQWPAYTRIGPNNKVSGANLRGQRAEILGAAHDPFEIESWSFDEGVKVPPSLDPLAGLGAARLDHRRQLLATIDRVQRQVEATDGPVRFNRLQQQAFNLLTSSSSKAALNIDAETDALRDRYGRTVFGQNCIVGRRLIEAGVPFVQVNWSGDAEDEQQGGDGGWDLHYRLFERMQDRYCPIFDRAFSALLADLDDRGLLESTIVLAMGEFGRSPKISGLGGRDHWPFGYSEVIAGGGMGGDKVIGASNFEGGEPRTKAIHPANINATILERMGLNRLELAERTTSVIEPPVAELL